MAVSSGLSGRVHSLQVGRPSLLPWRGGAVPSAIVKHEVAGPVRLGLENLDGDRQADLSVHGGPDKAVCCYASEHAERWTEVLGEPPPPGAFGENLTLEGLTEDRVHIGDEFTLGTALVQASCGHALPGVRRPARRTGDLPPRGRRRRAGVGHGPGRLLVGHAPGGRAVGHVPRGGGPRRCRPRRAVAGTRGARADEPGDRRSASRVGRASSSPRGGA